MGFDEAMKQAAKTAEHATQRAMKKYRAGLVTDEDDLTGVLIGNLDAALEGNIAGVNWTSSILRHRKGVAGEEKLIGADMLIHVSYQSPSQTYSKAVLVQAKRNEPDAKMSSTEHSDLIKQCNKMLGESCASFVFNYAKSEMRCASASKIAGSANRNLHSACNWTAYRFFLEFFRSPIGDSNITSALVADMPIARKLLIKGRSEIREE
jgi:hypothetical protein